MNRSANTNKQANWLYLSSQRSVPYTIDDITVMIPSAAHHYERRWEWFWPQYCEKTQPEVVRHTFIYCDPEEVQTLPYGYLVPNADYGIVDKTVQAARDADTRLFFRLANDIMIVRKGWEQLLVDQLNAVNGLQLIAGLEHGQVMPMDPLNLADDQPWFGDVCDPTKITAMVYPHGSRLIGQTSLFRGYYPLVQRFTRHSQDEFFFAQLIQGDGITITKFGGIERYLSHVGLPMKDFDDAQIHQIEEQRKRLEAEPDHPAFQTYP